MLSWIAGSGPRSSSVGRRVPLPAPSSVSRASLHRPDIAPTRRAAKTAFPRSAAPGFQFRWMTPAGRRTTLPASAHATFPAASPQNPHRPVQNAAPRCSARRPRNLPRTNYSQSAPPGSSPPAHRQVCAWTPPRADRHPRRTPHTRPAADRPDSFPTRTPHRTLSCPAGCAPAESDRTDKCRLARTALRVSALLLFAHNGPFGLCASI